MEAAFLDRVPRSSWRRIGDSFLPKEHGSWSLALEPLAFGLLVAPSISGGSLGLAALAAFLMRRPLKSIWRGRSDSQLRLKVIGVIILSSIALAGLMVTIILGDITRLWLLIPAIMAAIIFVWFDLRNEGRSEAAELAGTIAFGLLPAVFGALAGWGIIGSIALSVIMLARSVPTVMFVRTYMRLKRGREIKRWPALIAAGAAFLLTASLTVAGIVPWVALIFVVLMTTRTFWLLNENGPRLAAKTIGTMELIMGLGMVLALAMFWQVT